MARSCSRSVALPGEAGRHRPPSSRARTVGRAGNSCPPSEPITTSMRRTPRTTRRPIGAHGSSERRHFLVWRPGPHPDRSHELRPANLCPSLYVLKDGTLVCLHGSYAPGHGGLRIIFSTDGGHTWIAPAKDHGFLVDNCYGYGKAMELPDGTLLVTDQGTGGHSTADAKHMTLRALRVAHPSRPFRHRSSRGTESLKESLPGTGDIEPTY